MSQPHSREVLIELLMDAIPSSLDFFLTLAFYQAIGTAYYRFRLRKQSS